MRVSDMMYRGIVTIVLMAGAYVFLDFAFFDATRIAEELLLYNIFKVGIGFMLAQIIIYFSNRPYNKYMKQGRL